jgi:hypothetical protein
MDHRCDIEESVLDQEGYRAVLVLSWLRAASLPLFSDPCSALTLGSSVQNALEASFSSTERALCRADTLLKSGAP